MILDFVSLWIGKMGTVDRLIFVYLDGATPPDLRLLKLVGLENSVALVKDAFSSFMSEGASIEEIRNKPELDESGGKFSKLRNQSAEGIIVMYLIGHGWQDTAGQFQVSMLTSEGSEFLSGPELADVLSSLVSPESRLLLLVDTCEAESFGNCLRRLPTDDYTAIFASAIGERAWNLTKDGGSIFAFTLTQVMRRPDFRSRPRDAVELASAIKALIEKDVLAPAQSVSRLTHGRATELTSQFAEPEPVRRHRARRRMMLRLLACGIGIATLATSITLYWRTHVFVFIDLNELSEICDRPTIVVQQTYPQTNSVDEIRRIRVDGHSSAWLFLPADNLIVGIEATFNDGATRELRFHRTFLPSFSAQKNWRIAIPSSDEILNRPEMAFISAEGWLLGSDRVSGRAIDPFWIDIKQITIREYLPFAINMLKEGQVQSYESVLLTNILRHTDLEEESFPGDAERLLVMFPEIDMLVNSPDSPAPMTEIEAEVLSRKLKKRVATPEQWELSARGTDGRQFPWGERVDRDAVNAGLPRKHTRILRPSSWFPFNTSPFGMRDVVGNAGDWVLDGDGQYGFMGGELRLNAEDCTTFRYMRLPASHAGLADFAWRVGFRGTLPSSVASSNSPDQN